MVRIEEHLAEMRQIKEEMKNSRGYRHQCLLRQYNRMAKELKSAQMFLRQCGRDEKNGKVIK